MQHSSETTTSLYHLALFTFYVSRIHLLNKKQFVTVNVSMHKTIWNAFIWSMLPFLQIYIHSTHLFSQQLSPPPVSPSLALCFVFCHVPSPCYNYSLQGSSIHCDRAPLWWSGLCLGSHSWTIWMWSKNLPLPLEHISYKSWVWYIFDGNWSKGDLHCSKMSFLMRNTILI